MLSAEKNHQPMVFEGKKGIVIVTVGSKSHVVFVDIDLILSSADTFFFLFGQV